MWFRYSEEKIHLRVESQLFIYHCYNKMLYQNVITACVSIYETLS